MCAQLKIFPDSVLLNLHYAKYLKEFTYRAEEAIERLEHVRERSGNDPQILQLLMAYYAGLQFPNFERAHAFAQELEASAGQDSWAEFELAKFYVSWSTALLMQFCSDPIKDIVRRQRYKELADIAIRFLDDIYGRSHEWYYLMAQALYNRWEYDRALRQIEMAILELPPRSHLASGYLYFKSEIVKKRARFATA
jgi:tetratricopeptide (TPR) repeat protein